MGLIDASSFQEFDAHLESFYPVWVKREVEARGLSKEATTEFYPYFLTNVATDMKTTMIKSVREKVGLGENFFYGNGPESMNDRIKKRKGKGSRNLSWTECVDLLQSLSEEQERNAERALIDEGPYRLNTDYTHMRTPSANWLSLSQQQRQKKVSQFHSAKTKYAIQSKSSCTVISSATSQDISLSTVRDESSDDDVFEIPSENPSHESRNLTLIATQGMPQTAGKKPGTRGRSDKRPRQSAEHQRFTKNFSCRAPVAHQDISVNETEKYKFSWLRGTSVYVCYGCGQRMRPKPSDEGGRDMVPPPRFDVVLCRKELRVYKKPSGELTY
ncbi:uncharacterized protein LOC114969154 isoform X1 [Acropora millepora]|uniref:uncharacterized protein LOC114969154 isoform X1 n=1 Tax=Acropora millepora TaxID=45264 RepID=UPI001CF42D81|nr:uncharacterized protein LOC114969154 isoform X1 [Acropora millepora]